MKRNIFLLALAWAMLVSCNYKSSDDPVKQEDADSGGFVIRRGVNVSHWLSQTEMRGAERATYVGEADFKAIASMGFDHVRIPFDEMHMWDEEGRRHDDAFGLLHNAIGWAMDNGLRVIVDLHVLRSHHFNADSRALWTDPAAQESFWGFWKEMSAELKQYPVDSLAYELMNEAVADDPEDWNRLIAKGISVVRENEPDRVIVLGSNRWQQVHTFRDLKIPEGDRKLILSFHYYDPFILTHYRAPWTGDLQYYAGPVHYPGRTVDTVDYQGLEPAVLRRIRDANEEWGPERIREDMMKAKKVAEAYKLPLFCGEFGCYPSTPLELRRAYYRDMMAIFDELDIAWTHWNYKNDFPVADASTLAPIDSLVSVLIPR